MKKKFICTVCGYIHEGTEAPEQCPICKADKSKFNEMEVTDGELKFATVHYLGAAYKEGVSEELIQHCKETFAGECSEVGMYLAMARQADHASIHAAQRRVWRFRFLLFTSCSYRCQWRREGLCARALRLRD